MKKKTEWTMEEWEDIQWNSEEWKDMTGEVIEGQSRWMTFYSQVFKNLKTGHYYKLEWESGSTEQQDMSFDECWRVGYPVWPQEKVVVEYVPL